MKQAVRFVECSRTGQIVSCPYFNRESARKGLKILRGDFDGRGPLKGHSRTCLQVVTFKREE